MSGHTHLTLLRRISMVRGSPVGVELSQLIVVKLGFHTLPEPSRGRTTHPPSVSLGHGRPIPHDQLFSCWGFRYSVPTGKAYSLTVSSETGDRWRRRPVIFGEMMRTQCSFAPLAHGLSGMRCSRSEASSNRLGRAPESNRYTPLEDRAQWVAPGHREGAAQIGCPRRHVP